MGVAVMRRDVRSLPGVRWLSYRELITRAAQMAYATPASSPVN